MAIAYVTVSSDRMEFVSKRSCGASARFPSASMPQAIVTSLSRDVERASMFSSFVNFTDGVVQ